MLSSRPVTQFAGAIMGIALCVSSTAAGAAATPASSVAPISPLVALSAFGTPLSASAVRSTVNQPSAVSLQMTAAAAQGDPYAEGRPVPTLAVLLGLAVFAGWMVFILTRDGNNEIILPQLSPD